MQNTQLDIIIFLKWDFRNYPFCPPSLFLVSNNNAASHLQYHILNQKSLLFFCETLSTKKKVISAFFKTKVIHKHMHTCISYGNISLIVRSNGKCKNIRLLLLKFTNKMIMDYTHTHTF